MSDTLKRILSLVAAVLLGCTLAVCIIGMLEARKKLTAAPHAEQQMTTQMTADEVVDLLHRARDRVNSLREIEFTTNGVVKARIEAVPYIVYTTNNRRMTLGEVMMMEFTNLPNPRLMQLFQEFQREITNSPK